MSQRTARIVPVTVSITISITAWVGACPAPATAALPAAAQRS